MEYTILDKELRNVRSSLEKLEEERKKEAARREKSHESSEEDRQLLAEMATDLSRLGFEVQRLKASKTATAEQRQERLNELASVELDVAELNSLVGDESKSRGAIKNELKQLQKQIKLKEEKLAAVEPKIEEVRSEQERFQCEYDRALARQQELFGKRTRKSQFGSEKERDKWLDTEIKSLKKTQSDKVKQQSKAEEEVRKLEATISAGEIEVTERKTQIIERKERMEQINSDITAAKARRNELTEVRRSTWAAEAKLDSAVQSSKEELDRAERELYATMGKTKAGGIAAIKQLTEELKLDGVHGPLIELISCAKQFQCAVETTAGGTLFDIVVDSDVVASRLIKEINRRKIDARITFLPLNRLSSATPSLPQSSDALAMHEKIQHDPKFQRVINHVFGKTLICRDLKTAADFSRTHGIDCITLEGDKVHRKGALTGGYVDTKTSKLELQLHLTEMADKLKVTAAEQARVKKDKDQAEQQINNEISTVEKLEAEKLRMRTNYDNLRADVASLEHKAESLADTLAMRKIAQNDIGAAVEAIVAKIAAHEAEKGTAIESQLDEAEETEIAELTDEMSQVRSQITSCLEEREVLEREQTQLKTQLDKNLRLKEAELIERNDDFSIADRQASLSAKEAELAAVKASVADLRQEAAAVEEALAAKEERIREVSQAMDEAKAEERKRLGLGAEADKVLEGIMNKRSLKLQKQEEFIRKIRELGALPRDIEKYQQLDIRQLYKQLSGVQKKLKDPKYRQVNKKALDQYVSFSEQRDALTGRKGEQDTADASISELINVLDNQKDEAIERTFKQVSKYFSEVFKELVPDGRANLVMQRRVDKPPPEDEEEDSATGSGSAAASRPIKLPSGRIEMYVGVAVKVSFTGKETETQLLQQLSGGQKTVVALALIFAIQRCDPAPFYLFDEIDAALDAAHRTAVADMITRLKGNAQFITTTFRPEMLLNANKLYGVTFHNKVRPVDCF